MIPIAGHLGGQGDEASIGYANFEKKIFEQTRDAHPELAGRQWEELYRAQYARAGRWINADTEFGG